MTLLFLNGSVVSKEQLLFLLPMFSLSSYCNMNTFHCSQYWSYNEGIPSKLHERDKEFVLHCLERGRISLGSDLSGIFCREKTFFKAEFH